MTSELRPAVAVWLEAAHTFKHAPPQCKLEQADQAAAAVIEADREAVRAEQAAELAKWQALAETLAGALEQIEEGTYARPLGKPWRMDASSSKHDRCIHDAWMYEACEACIDAFAAEALREYKEARDV